MSTPIKRYQEVAHGDNVYPIFETCLRILKMTMDERNALFEKVCYKISEIEFLRFLNRS